MPPQLSCGSFLSLANEKDGKAGYYPIVAKKFHRDLEIQEYVPLIRACSCIM
jgi:hypothetical protein